MRYGVSESFDYSDSGSIVIRDFQSEPRGRVLCVITRSNQTEATEIAQYLCDLLNKEEIKTK
jgi:hypothetical protein